MKGKIVQFSLILLTLVVAVAGSCSAAVLCVVHDSATTGQPCDPDNVNWDNPYPSIELALASANSGDEVWVAQGTYTATDSYWLSLPSGVSMYGGFAIGNASRDLRTEGCVTTLRGCSIEKGFNTIEYDVDGQSTIDGFTFEYTGTAIAEVSGSLVISNNKFNPSGSDSSTVYEAVMLYGSGTTRPQIHHNLFSQNYMAIGCYCTADIYDNVFTDCTCGIGLEGTGNNTSFINNTMSDNTTAVEIGNQFTGIPTIANNIIVTPTDTCGVHAYAAANPVLSNNCVYGDGTHYIGIPDPTPNDGNISANPCFVDAANNDFHLGTDSPCIDTANDNLVIDSTGTDYYGSPRSVYIHGQANVDMGAAEFKPLTVTINKADNQADPTNTSPANFTVTFSEPVTGFTDDDVTISGVTGATKTITGSGTTYNVAVSLPTAGTIVATVPAGVVRNEFGVWNSEATHTHNSVLFDNVAPTVGTCAETPAVSSGQVTINYAGAADTGGSDLLAVGLYEVVGGQYTLLDARTGSSNSFTISYTGNGMINNLVLIAWDNAGNQSVGHSVPSFTIDQTPPTAPIQVTLDPVISYYGAFNITWSGASDALSGIRSYTCNVYHKAHGSATWASLGSVVSPGSGNRCTFSYLDSNGNPLTQALDSYAVEVYATDNAGNVSATATMSNEEMADAAKVAFLSYLSTPVEASHIDYWLQALYESNASAVRYYGLSQMPPTSQQLNEYNTVVVACPSRALNETELSLLSSFVAGFQKRIVLLGENGSRAASNGFLNELANRIGVGTRFDTGTGSYDNATSDMLSCAATTGHYLCSGVTHIGDAGSLSLVLGPSCNVVAWLRNAQNGVLAVEEDTADAGSRVLIQDCGLFNNYYIGRWDNWRFVYNLCTLYRR